MSVERLKLVYEEYRDCTSCSLGTAGKRKLRYGFFCQPRSSDILLVGGMFPEDVASHNFGNGGSGYVLEKLGKMLDYDFKAHLLTGPVICPTMNEEDVGQFGFEVCPKPKKEQVSACKERLHAEIRAVAPKLIVAFGETALSAVSARPAQYKESFGYVLDHQINGLYVQFPMPVLTTFSLLELYRSSDMSVGGIWNQAFNHMQRALQVVERLNDNS